MKTPEELRAYWKTLSYPDMFDPEQPNWTDLSVTEIADHLGNFIGPMAKESTFRNYFVRASRDSITEVPYLLRDRITGKPLTIPQVFSDWEFSHWLRCGQPLLDPDDEVYFYQPQLHQTMVSLHESAPSTPTIFRLSPYGFLCSKFWEDNWALRIDLATNVGAGLTEEQAKQLLSPQSVKKQFRSEAYPGLSIVNRSYLGSRDWDAASFGRLTCLEDGWLFYYQFVMVDREGEYPFPFETKERVIEAAGDVISQSLQQEQDYMTNLLRIFRFAQSQKTHFDIFAAKEF